VVWANQREPLAAAVGAAGSDKKLVANHPLISDGQKLIPSITKVFRRDQQLYVFFEVYDPGADPATKAPNLAASVSFFRGKLRAFESGAVHVTHAPEKGNSIGVQFQIPLEKLKPGDYTCQVNVIDETGKKFAFRRTPLVLLP